MDNTKQLKISIHEPRAEDWPEGDNAWTNYLKETLAERYDCDCNVTLCGYTRKIFVVGAESLEAEACLEAELLDLISNELWEDFLRTVDQ